VCADIYRFSTISMYTCTSIYCHVGFTPREGWLSVDMYLFSTISTYISTSIFCPVGLTQRVEAEVRVSI